MKIFANRSIWKKIVIIFSLIFSISFVEPPHVEAGIGGTLMEPVCDLLVGLGDGVMNVTHHVLIGQETTLIRVNLKDGGWGIVRIVVTILAVAAALAAAALLTAGGAIAIGWIITHLGGVAASGIIGSALMANIVPIAVFGVYVGVKAYNSDAFLEEVDLPLYSISPERIFSNKVPLFDVNFFNPNSAPFKYEWIHKTSMEEYAQQTTSANGKYTEITSDEVQQLKLDFSKGVIVTDQFKKDVSNYNITKAIQIEVGGVKYIRYEQGTSMPAGYKKINDTTTDSGTDTSNVNSSAEEGKKYSFSYELANTVKFWYRIIRTLAIVGMMSVLVYIGIRILLSSTSEKKAQYKQLLGDWLVGMVLLFTMQYIMVFSNIAVDHLTELFSSINPMGQTALIPDDNDKVKNELKEYGIETIDGGDAKEITKDNNGNLSADVKSVYRKTENGKDGKTHKFIEWNTDLMGRLRIDLQAYKDSSEGYIGYTIMYMVMIIYTGIFFFTYAKRVVYMAFLTIISPLVALTYPIDKVNDGSAQGFNYWFKEYIFNLLLQPVHLLVYTILVSTAIKFATENVIYALVALGFITQAEKIVRQMFNFSKASTPGVFAGPAGAAMAMTGMRWLMGRGPNATDKSSGGNSGKDSGITSGGNKTKVMDSQSLGGLLGTDDTTVDVSSEIRTAPIQEEENNGDTHTEELGESGKNGDENNLSGSPIRFANTTGYDLPDESGSGESGDNLEVMEDTPENDEPIASPLNIPRNRGTYENRHMSADEYIAQRNKENWIKNNRMSAREYIESKENGEAIAVRRLNEKRRESKKERQKIKMALGDATDAYKDGIKEKIRSGLENGQPGKKLRKMAGGALGAATFGTFGVAAGVASGDMKSVMTDGVAGIAGGYKLGSGTATAVSNATNVEGVGDTFERSYYGEQEYKNRIAKMNQLKKAREDATIRRIQEKEKVSRVEAKRRAEEYAQVYMEEGINDVDDWILLEKMTKQKVIGKNGRTINRNYTRKEAVGAYKALNRSVGTRDKADALKKIKADYNLEGKNEAAETIYRTAKLLDNLKEGEI